MLDFDSKKEIKDFIFKLNKEENITIISITHDVEEVINADKIIVLDQGNLVFEGTKEELYKMPKQLNTIELPNIMKLEKELGFEEYIPEERFYQLVGDIHEC